MARVLDETAHRLGDNYPYFHPLYAGQMLKPPHPVARAAYALAMKINPNNHARDGGRASSEMEIEAVAEIAADVRLDGVSGPPDLERDAGQPRGAVGGGAAGAGRADRGSEQAHYTHQRISGVLKLDYASVPADGRGRMDLEALEDELRKGDVGTVVVTLGTTAIGAVDPLDEILALRQRYGFRVHVDAAYGGYFRPDSGRAGRAGAAGVCGDRTGRLDRRRSAQARAAAIWVRMRAVSRPGGGALLQARFALYLLHVKGVAPRRDQPGVLARRSGGGGVVGHATTVAACAGRRVCIRARKGGGRRWSWTGGCARMRALRRSPAAGRSWTLWCGRSMPQLLKKLQNGPKRCLTHAPGADCTWRSYNCRVDGSGRPSQTRDTVTCLRSVLMKPEHEEWLDEIWERLSAACADVVGA